jgi:lipopolysaccharide transport system permease protein
MTASQIEPDAGFAAASPQYGDASALEPGETVIEATSGWQSLGLAELWKARDLLYFLTWRNVKIRYKQTLLGAAWAVLQPLLMMVVFTWTIGRIAGFQASSVPYPLYVFSGLLPWTFFQTAVTGAANSVVASEGLVTKVYFPRLVIPLSAVAAALVDFAVAFVLLLILMGWYGVAPGLTVLLVPAALILVVVAALGIGTLIAALNVAYRDFRYVVTFLVQIWMLATTSIYFDLSAPASADGTPVSGWGSALAYLNPMIAVVELFRGAAIGTEIPWGRVAVSTSLLSLLMVGAFYYFRRVEDSFADVI